MGDPRLDIWNVLHDGEITVIHREAPDVVVMFVNIPYVRRRIEPLGDSFRLRLGGFRSIHFANDIGDTSSDLDYVEGYEILDILSETMPAKIQLAEGTLTLDFDTLDISLDSGQPIAYERVLRVAKNYWDEFAARTKQV
jgi:hypothetical protein